MSDAGIPDIQRWSEEVARDPAAPAFLSLARAYRRQGRRDAALRICLRALERQPTHVEGHALLALLYLETGEREKASDEWATVLRLDPGNFDAHRGLGFVYLERGDYDAARRHLEEAARVRPEDPAVRDALALARAGGVGAPAGASGGAAGASAGADAVMPAAGAAETQGGAGAAGHTASRVPRSVFEELMADSRFLGALVLDVRGAVTAGTLAMGGQGGDDVLGAVFGEAVEEAARLAGVLGIGAWQGILLHTDAALLNLSPLGGGYTLVVAGTPDAPDDWMLRTADRARALGRAFMGV